MDRGDVPKVEDWKRAILTYKNNSIALGVIDAPDRDSILTNSVSSEPTIVVQAPSPHKFSHAGNETSSRIPSPECLPDGILLSADVVSFHFEMEEYWFRIDATFQPYNPHDMRNLPPAKQLILFRVYNDFYDFQVALLDAFPREAGRQPPSPRILPYMPGPAEEVDQTLTATRRAELNEYLHKLCNLSPSGARYILEHRVVREFLALKPGDVDNDIEPKTEEMESLFGQDFSDQRTSQDYGDEYGNEVRDTLGRLKVQGNDDKSDGSEYEDEGYAPSPQRRANDHHPYGQSGERRPSFNDGSQNSVSLRQHAHAQNHQRTGSTSSFHRTPSPYSTNSRSSSPAPRRNSPQPQQYSPSRSIPTRSPLESDPRSNYPYRWDPHTNPLGNNEVASPTTSNPSVRSSQATSMSGRSRSHSTATSNLNTPPISAANPQTAFVKIKIFDRLADDLIAIRVHPRVSHGELMEKIQARLGGEVGHLRYRDSMSHTFVGLDSDGDLRAWMDGTDKHVLYAD